MEINKTRNGNELTIAIKGELNTLTSMDLERELKSSMDGITSLIFDFKNLEYITSAGLRVIQSAQNVMDDIGGVLIVKNINDEVRNIFEITGFLDFLNIQ